MHDSRHHRRGNAGRGKLWLIALFFLLRVPEPFLYFDTRAADQSTLLGGILIGVVWTGALMAGIWNRQNWARYILIALLFLDIFFAFKYFAAQRFVASTQLASLMELHGSFFVLVAVKVITVTALLISPDIKRLCRTE